MTRWTRFAPALLVGSLLLARAHGAVTPGPLFRDHLVLQQAMPVPVWGTAAADEAVAVTFAGQTQQTKAAADGKWLVKLAPLAANATPADLTITGTNTVVVKDVLVGEVWLASGQSNMGWTVRPQDYAEEIAKADRPLIRSFNVPTVGSLTPKDSCGGAWQLCSPKTLPSFTAVGYFFIKKVQEELKVPVGLINSSWGGTQAESWISREAIMANPAIKDLATAQITALERRPDDERKFAEALPAWQQKYGALAAGNKGFDQGWHKPEFDAAGWKPINLPVNFSRLGLKAGGVIWLRKDLDVPADAAGKSAQLELGGTDDGLDVYFNGTRLKPSWGREAAPFYRRNVYLGLPGNLVKAGRNTVAVRVYSLTERGGLWRTAAQMRLPGGLAKDADQWRYEVEASFPALTPEARREQPTPPTAEIHNTATGLFNSMINPLVPFAVRGAIWYQGESNTGRSKQYRTVLTTLIEDWRKRWGLGEAFAFHVVQLANLGRVPQQPEENGWAELREAQEQVTRTLPNCGLAVTIDIGEANDVHPRNKHDVGLRLALHALVKTYGRKVECSGPQCETAVVEGKKIRLKFSHCEGGLVAKGGELKHFAIAGRDGKYRWAKAVVEGDSVIVSSPEVPEPVSVRYAWAGNPEGCNLYNLAGLPASPFRTDQPK